MKICEYCNKKHDGKFATGRFCSSKCAKGFSTKAKRKEINKKVSYKLKGRNDFIWNKLEPKISICIICGKSFEIEGWNNKNVCSKKCGYIKRGFILKKVLKGKTGGYRKGSGRSKGAYYKKQYFDSNFEIEVAKFLDKNDIKWKRNTKRFYFNWKNKKTYYIPDFIIENKIYLETKGYWYKDKYEKTIEAVNINKLNWILLLQKEEWIKDKNIVLQKIQMARGTA